MKLDNIIDWMKARTTKVLGAASAILAFAAIFGWVKDADGVELLLKNVWEGVAAVLSAIAGIMVLLHKEMPTAKNAFGDFIDRLTSYKSTILGASTAIISFAVVLGWIKIENQEGIIEGIKNTWEGVAFVLGAINGIILIFSKDK